ncbi:MAG: hypothetical protein PHD99_04905 [Candidatus Moranbacteria bacterium]|nr:hypothetical protein [Candidatus Moranbacteria bacterium]
MEMIPGVVIDRAVLGTLNLPPSKRKKAQAEIKASRSAKVEFHTESASREDTASTR